MMPLFTMESMTGPAAFSLALASALSPVSMAFSTLLMAVRNLERRAMLWARRLMVWRARFSADLILATDVSGCAEKRGANSADEGPPRQAEKAGLGPKSAVVSRPVCAQPD